MAKPNYQYEKRARELAKKQKKEDKLKRRQENALKNKGEGEDEAGLVEGQADAGEGASGTIPADNGD